MTVKSSVTLGQIQEYVKEVEVTKKWDKQIGSFGGLLLVEELTEIQEAMELHSNLSQRIGRVAKAIRNQEVGRFGHDEINNSDQQKLEAIGDECADVLFAIVKVANYYGLDLATHYHRLQYKIKDRFPELKEKDMKVILLQCGNVNVVNCVSCNKTHVGIPSLIENRADKVGWFVCPVTGNKILIPKD